VYILVSLQNWRDDLLCERNGISPLKWQTGVAIVKEASCCFSIKIAISVAIVKKLAAAFIAQFIISGFRHLSN
jgi:hypothetical protein